MNSFDLLRLLAAVAVIFHHSRRFAGAPSPTFFHLDFGALGVGVFFVISGYLVTASFQRSATVFDYLKKRILRIEPGLAVSVAVTALLIGAAATALPVMTYVARPEVWLYIVRNALLYPVTYALPGLFEGNPLTAVNPSLWTLRVEFTLYLLIAALGAARLLRFGVVAGLAAAAAATALVLITFLPKTLSGSLMAALVGAQFGFLFLAGAALQLWGRRPPLWSLATLAFLATPMWVLGLPAAVILAGERRSFRPPADISYGLYIYACPVQQVLHQVGALSFTTSMLATLPLALASWFLVERPALSLKPQPAAAGVVQAPGSPPPGPRGPATTPATRRN